jgi:DNA-binding NarL/FixJ family response regulator
MTGDRLAREIMKIRPDIPILLCTGYSERVDKDTAKEIGIAGFAMKPLDMGELARMIRELLDGREKFK